MKDRYDYNIVTEKLNPPIGTALYAARLDLLVRLNETEGGPSERIGTPPGLAERYGKTEHEAYQQMTQAINAWIESQ